MKNKKLASLGLAVTMVTNVVPAMATITPVNGGHEAKEEHAGERPTDAEVCATQDVDDNETADCTVYAEVGSEFMVTIPKSLTLSGTDKTGAYDIAVEGDIAGDQYVSVVPDEQFPMVQDGKADVTATVTQEITKFRGDIYTGTLGEGEALFATGAEGAIDAQGLTAGAWNGTFNFNIKLEGGIVEEEPEIEGIAFALTKDNRTKIGYTGAENEELVIPANFVNPDDGLTYKVTSIESAAFQNCEKLTSVTIPSTVTSIGEYAFNSCTGLTSITIPNKVTTIDDYAFYSCSGLTKLTIGKNVTSIGQYAFGGCTELTEVVIPNSVTTIDWDAFNGCTKLTSATISNNITVIPNRMFRNCSSLTSVIIPDGVTKISYWAFDGCSKLTSVTIPDSVTEIKEDAFNGCTELITVNYKGTKEQWDAIIIENNNNPLVNANIVYNYTE